MLAAFGWILGTTLIGWLCLPLTHKIFRNLPGKGYAFSRAVGLLLWGFIHWLLVSVGILKNTLTGQIIVLAALTAVSVGILYITGFRDFTKWLRLNWRLVLSVELVFLVSFAAFAVFRSTSPGITGTEKPMELAFLNGILRSETFPPQDPWLSGYGISYYYFGYVMVAMLARLTGTPSAVAYNLAQALWFGLIAVGAYGLLADLLAKRHQTKRHLRWALLAPVMILLVSNVYGFLDSLHARGVLRTQDVMDGSQSGFWTWVNQKGLTGSPAEPPSYIPQEQGTAAWWQASRVISDVNFSGEAKEIIDEFPNFSFVLGDLHPHLLAAPFALLAMGLAFNFLLAPPQETRLAGRWRLPFSVGRFTPGCGPDRLPGLFEYLGLAVLCRPVCRGFSPPPDSGNRMETGPPGGICWVRSGDGCGGRNLLFTLLPELCLSGWGNPAQCGLLHPRGGILDHVCPASDPNPWLPGVEKPTMGQGKAFQKSAPYHRVDPGHPLVPFSLAGNCGFPAG